jgi:hypothetical protein
MVLRVARAAIYTIDITATIHNESTLPGVAKSARRLVFPANPEAPRDNHAVSRKASEVLLDLLGTTATPHRLSLPFRWRLSRNQVRHYVAATSPRARSHRPQLNRHRHRPRSNVTLAPFTRFGTRGYASAVMRRVRSYGPQLHADIAHHVKRNVALHVPAHRAARPAQRPAIAYLHVPRVRAGDRQAGRGGGGLTIARSDATTYMRWLDEPQVRTASNNARRRLTPRSSCRGPASARRPSRLVQCEEAGGTPAAITAAPLFAAQRCSRRAATASARGPWPRSLA